MNIEWTVEVGKIDEHIRETVFPYDLAEVMAFMARNGNLKIEDFDKTVAALKGEA